MGAGEARGPPSAVVDMGGRALGASRAASAASRFRFLSLRISITTATAQATPMMLPARPTPSATPRSLFLLPPPPPLLAEPGVDVADAAVAVTPDDEGSVPDAEVVRLEVLVVPGLVVVVFLDVVDVAVVDVEAKARVAVLLRANPEVPSVQQPEPQQ